MNSGSDANDLAMLMARMYTGHFDVLSFRSVLNRLRTCIAYVLHWAVEAICVRILCV